MMHFRSRAHRRWCAFFFLEKFILLNNNFLWKVNLFPSPLAPTPPPNRLHPLSLFTPLFLLFFELLSFPALGTFLDFPIPPSSPRKSLTTSPFKKRTCHKKAPPYFFILALIAFFPPPRISWLIPHRSFPYIVKPFRISLPAFGKPLLGLVDF